MNLQGWVLSSVYRSATENSEVKKWIAQSCIVYRLQTLGWCLHPSLELQLIVLLSSAFSETDWGTKVMLAKVRQSLVGKYAT